MQAHACARAGDRQRPVDRPAAQEGRAGFGTQQVPVDLAAIGPPSLACVLVSAAGARIDARPVAAVAVAVPAVAAAGAGIVAAAASAAGSACIASCGAATEQPARPFRVITGYRVG